MSLLGNKKVSKIENEKVDYINVSQISVNEYQPRTIFDDEKINELAESIKKHGIIQPIIVRKQGDMFQIVAGERRFRAAQRNGMEEVPAIVKNLDDRQTATIAVIENIQRENLTAIEEAKAFKQIMESEEITQEVLAQRLGKAQSTIANKIRLLSLPNNIQNSILKKEITERHARSLLSIKDLDLQYKIFEEVLKKKLNVKDTEKLIEKKLNLKEKIKSKSNIITKIPKDIRMAMNTFNQAISLIERTGLNVDSQIEQTEDHYQITIRIPIKE